MERKFRLTMNASMQLKSGSRINQVFYILHASKNVKIDISCALTIAMIKMKNNCILIHLSFIEIDHSMNRDEGSYGTNSYILTTATGSQC